MVSATGRNVPPPPPLQGDFLPRRRKNIQNQFSKETCPSYPLRGGLGNVLSPVENIKNDVRLSSIRYRYGVWSTSGAKRRLQCRTLRTAQQGSFLSRVRTASPPPACTWRGRSTHGPGRGGGEGGIITSESPLEWKTAFKPRGANQCGLWRALNENAVDFFENQSNKKHRFFKNHTIILIYFSWISKSTLFFSRNIFFTHNDWILRCVFFPNKSKIKSNHLYFFTCKIKSSQWSNGSPENHPMSSMSGPSATPGRRSPTGPGNRAPRTSSGNQTHTFKEWWGSSFSVTSKMLDQIQGRNW